MPTCRYIYLAARVPSSFIIFYCIQHLKQVHELEAAQECEYDTHSQISDSIYSSTFLRRQIQFYTMFSTILNHLPISLKLAESVGLLKSISSQILIHLPISAVKTE